MALEGAPGFVLSSGEATQTVALPPAPTRSTAGTSTDATSGSGCSSSGEGGGRTSASSTVVSWLLVAHVQGQRQRLPGVRVAMPRLGGGAACAALAAQAAFVQVVPA